MASPWEERLLTSHLASQVSEMEVNGQFESVCESVFSELESQAVEALDLPMPGCFRMRSHSYVRAIEKGCSQDDECVSLRSSSPPRTTTTVRTIQSSTGECAEPAPRTSPRPPGGASTVPRHCTWSSGWYHTVSSHQTPPTPREASQPPATVTHPLPPPSASPVSPEETATRGLRETAQGGDIPKMPTQHPRTSTLIPPNSCSPSPNPPVQGYDPLHESDTLIAEHRRAGKLLKSQDIHKMTLPKDLNCHCETIRNG